MPNDSLMHLVIARLLFELHTKCAHTADRFVRPFAREIKLLVSYRPLPDESLITARAIMAARDFMLPDALDDIRCIQKFIAQRFIRIHPVYHCLSTIRARMVQRHAEASHYAEMIALREIQRIRYKQFLS